MNVTALAAGYVGLIRASCHAEIGNAVIPVDVDTDKLDLLASERFYQPSLPELVTAMSASGAFASQPTYSTR